MDNGNLSHLHMVDLIGTSPLDDREFNSLSGEEREARRELGLVTQI
jgi:hypothetical protein